MPNWVYNSVVVSGDKKELERLAAKLGAPVETKSHEVAVGKMEWVDTTLNNPIFSFQNVVAPTDLEAYWGPAVKGEETIIDGKMDQEAFAREFKRSMAENNDWYHWNVRNWGTKWDIAVFDEQQYADTTMEWIAGGGLLYRFETAWSPVFEIFEILTKEFPTLEFDYAFEEETGWGGEVTWLGGVKISESDYDSPSSHAAYEKLGRECDCVDDPENRYEDCPAVA
jgi:hypothetical protein